MYLASLHLILLDSHNTRTTTLKYRWTKHNYCSFTKLGQVIFNIEHSNSFKNNNPRVVKTSGTKNDYTNRELV